MENFYYTTLDMHAFLIHSNNKDFIETKTQELIHSLQSIKLTYELQTIEQVREITKFTQLTAKHKSTIFVENIDQASVDAQNAFLKTLEEPQENISFILTAASIEPIVSTILSRVEIVSDETQREVSEETIKQAADFFEKSAGEQLVITSKIKKREEAIGFLEKLIHGGHKIMIENTKYALAVESAQATFNDIKRNGNVQIQLTNFVVQLHE